MRLCFLERYSILNKAVPALNLSYGQGKDCQLKYSGRIENGIPELLKGISASFQDLKQATVCYTEKLRFSLLDLYDDKLGSLIT